MGRLYVATLVIMLFLVACAVPSVPPQQQIPPGSGASQAVKDQVPVEAWQAEWDKVLAAAKKEGTVAIMSDGGASLRDALVAGFGKAYGLNVEIIAGKGAQLAEKVLTEQRNGLFLNDVQHGGATTKITQLKPAGAYQPLELALIRKDILDPKFWNPGQPSWVDKEHTILNIEYSASGKLGINTNLVKPGELKSLRDLLDPKWKGKIIINDPTISGTGAKFIGVVAVTQGWDIWREIAARQEPVIMRDEKLMVTWLAQGKYPVIISPKTEPMFDAEQAGAPVADIDVKEAKYATGDTVSFLKNAPHPNAAKLYINWLLSKEGQTIYHQAQGSWSARTDVVTDGVASKKPEPGVEYFNSNAEEFLLGQTEQMRIAKEIFGPLMK